MEVSCYFHVKSVLVVKKFKGEMYVRTFEFYVIYCITQDNFLQNTKYNFTLCVPNEMLNHILNFGLACVILVIIFSYIRCNILSIIRVTFTVSIYIV